MAETVLNLDPASDSGTAEDGLTNDSTPRLNGTADAGSTVNIYDGAVLVGTAVADGQGVWSHTLSVPLANGSHTLTALATDAHGVTGAPSDALALTIDTTAPTASMSAFRGASPIVERVLVTFSEAPVGLTKADFVTQAAYVRQLTQLSPTEFMVEVDTDPRALDDSIHLVAGSYMDAAGNLGQASNGVTIGLLGGQVIEVVEETHERVDGHEITRRVLNDGGQLTEELTTSTGKTQGTPPPLDYDRLRIEVRETAEGLLNVKSPVLPANPGQAAAQLAALQAWVQHQMEVYRDIGFAQAVGGAMQSVLEGLPGQQPPPAPVFMTLVGNPLSGGGPLSPAPVITVSGAPGGQGGSSLILDGSGLAPNTIIKVDDVGMVAVVGQVQVIGGHGKQVAVGDRAGQTIILGEGDDQLHGGGGNDTVGSAEGNDLVTGDDGDDVVFGGEGDDLVHGNLGADTVNGGDGNDLVYGGRGNDKVSGDAGDDQIFGDLGDDTLSGGAGADLFHLQAGGGHDLVTDFDASQGDRLVVAAGMRVVAHQMDEGLLVSLDDGASMLLAGARGAELLQSWIVFA